MQVSGNCVSGEGSVLGSAAVLQDRAFWCSLSLSLCRSLAPSVCVRARARVCPAYSLATRAERHRMRVIALQGGQGGNTGYENRYFKCWPLRSSTVD